MTFNLLTTSEGVKMGKTEKGALWLDANKTPPYEFYQYWRNINDKDVINCLKLLTFLPMDEIEKLSKLEGQEINEAKKVLAYEVTKLIHGEEEAIKAQNAAQALFGKGVSSDDMPTTEISNNDILDGINIIDLLVKTKLVPSKGEGRRLIQQGGISVNNEKINEFNFTVKTDDFKDNELIIKKGKKVYHKVKLV